LPPGPLVVASVHCAASTRKAGASRAASASQLARASDSAARAFPAAVDKTEEASNDKANAGFRYFIELILINLSAIQIQTGAKSLQLGKGDFYKISETHQDKQLAFNAFAF
jgi:hypothetical protein